MRRARWDTWLGSPGRALMLLVMVAAAALPALKARAAPPPPTVMAASLAGTWVFTRPEEEARADNSALQLILRVAEALPRSLRIAADGRVEGQGNMRVRVFSDHACVRLQGEGPGIRIWNVQDPVIDWGPSMPPRPWRQEARPIPWTLALTHLETTAAGLRLSAKVLSREVGTDARWTVHYLLQPGGAALLPRVMPVARSAQP